VRYGDEALPRTKLEVYSARALRTIERGTVSAAAFAVAYMVTLAALAGGRWAGSIAFDPTAAGAAAFAAPADGGAAAAADGRTVLTVGLVPEGLLLAHVGAAVAMTAGAAVAAAWFTARVAGLPAAARTDEQLWAAALLWASTLFLAPTHEVDAVLVLGALRRVAAPPLPGGPSAADAAAAAAAVGRLGHWAVSAASNGWAAFLFWYVGTSTASFRVLPGQGRRAPFYAPRLGVLAAHVALRVGVSTARPRPRLALSAFPVAPAAYLVRWARAPVPPAPGVTADAPSFAAAVAVLAVEGALGAWIAFEAYCTAGALAGVPYALHRTKHVGWRSFRHHANLLALAVGGATAAAAALAPDGLPTLAARSGAAVWLAEPLGLTVPLKLLVLAYALVEGVVNLPPDVVGWRGLLHRMPVVAQAGQSLVRTKFRERHTRLPPGGGGPPRGEAPVRPGGGGGPPPRAAAPPPARGGGAGAPPGGPRGPQP